MFTMFTEVTNQGRSGDICFRRPRYSRTSKTPRGVAPCWSVERIQIFKSQSCGFHQLVVADRLSWPTDEGEQVWPSNHLREKHWNFNWECFIQSKNYIGKSTTLPRFIVVNEHFSRLGLILCLNICLVDREPPISATQDEDKQEDVAARMSASSLASVSSHHGPHTFRFSSAQTKKILGILGATLLLISDGEAGPFNAEEFFLVLHVWLCLVSPLPALKMTHLRQPSINICM